MKQSKKIIKRSKNIKKRSPKKRSFRGGNFFSGALGAAVSYGATKKLLENSDNQTLKKYGPAFSAFLGYKFLS